MGKRVLFQARSKTFQLGERTWIMGVVNVTPDSFYDGGIYYSEERAIARGLELIEEGVDIVDIGGESSRPGSDPVLAEEELKRVIPVISALRKESGALISIDTTKAEVAEAAIAAGADILNDISSFRFDPHMLRLAAQTDVGVILMHMKGTPKTMQINPTYTHLMAEVKSFLKERMDVAEAYGIKTERLVIDPGIGFGKNLEDNLILLNSLSYFEDLKRPILVGISRKSFIGKILSAPPQERLEGTIASAVVSIMRGASILRVHDPREVKRAILVAEAILNRADNSATEGNTSKYVH